LLSKKFKKEEIAQLVRVLTCHVKCCGFKSRFSREFKTEEMAEWLKAVDCKSIKFNFT